jgi:hypothetical protein
MRAGLRADVKASGKSPPDATVGRARPRLYNAHRSLFPGLSAVGADEVGGEDGALLAVIRSGPVRRSPVGKPKRAPDSSVLFPPVRYSPVLSAGLNGTLAAS